MNALCEELRKVAFEIPPPNRYTPVIIGLANSIELDINKMKREIELLENEKELKQELTP